MFQRFFFLSVVSDVPVPGPEDAKDQHDMMAFWQHVEHSLLAAGLDKPGTVYLLF